MRWVALAMLASCGRIGFDPRAGGDGNVPGDGKRDAPGPGDVQSDAPNACANAIPLTLDMRAAVVSTCSGIDRTDACGSSGKQEVVFSYTPLAATSLNAQAYDPGTSNITTSTQRYNANCVPVAGCAAVLGFAAVANEPVYLVVETPAGGCKNIEFELD